MQTINFRHQLHLRGLQALLIVLLVGLFGPGRLQAQNFEQTNLPNYDERLLHFGFTLGVHQSSFRLAYSDEYSSGALDSLHSIQPDNSTGFSIGFLANFHVLQYLDLRPMFKVAFYEYPVNYHYTDGTIRPQRPEAAYVEMPLTVKYRSLRRRNFGMYLVGGVTPGIQVGGRRADDDNEDLLHIHTEDLKLEYGLGLDIYYPLFKFSPELRVAHGIRNMVRPNVSDWSNGIDRLVTHSVSLYLNFQ